MRKRKGESITSLVVVALPTFVYGVYRFSVGFIIPKIEEAYSINHPLMGGIVSVSVGVAGLGVLSTGYFVGKL